MSTPIKSNSQASTATSNASLPFALNELVSKMNGPAKSESLDNPEQAFARWMERHAFGADAEQASASTVPTNTASSSPSNSTSMARLGEQAIARMRQQTAAHQPVVQREMPATHAEQPAQSTSPTASKAANDKPNANKTASKSAAKPAQADKSDKAEKADKDDEEVAFSTPLGEGSAMVRELTPPSNIQPGDSAAMMAWLSSLTHGELKQGPDGALQAAGGAAGDAAGQPGAGKEDGEGIEPGLSMSEMLQRGRGGAGQGGATLDLSSWQGAAGKGEDLAKLALGAGKTDGDQLAGMLANGAMKPGGFNQVLGEATQAMRHESATLNVPFGDSNFTQALSDQVSMWVSKAQGDGPMTAELHLNPAEMGPINVKISLDGQSAHVDFAAAALETRQAIEASLPMLSNALGDIGLSLTGGDVSSQTSQQAFQQAAQSGGSSGRASGTSAGGAGDDSDASGVRQVAAPRPGRAGGLDLYA